MHPSTERILTHHWRRAVACTDGIALVESKECSQLARLLAALCTAVGLLAPGARTTLAIVGALTVVAFAATPLLLKRRRNRHLDMVNALLP